MSKRRLRPASRGRNPIICPSANHETIMNAKLWPLIIVLPLSAGAAHAQESVRDLSGPGQFNKFLTPGQLDRWVFDGEKGETIIAHVFTKEFDPILELAKSGPKDDDKVL